MPADTARRARAVAFTTVTRVWVENIARVIWNLLEPKIPHGQLHRVRLYETPDLFADCYRDERAGRKVTA